MVVYHYITLVSKILKISTDPFFFFNPESDLVLYQNILLLYECYLNIINIIRLLISHRHTIVFFFLK